MRSMVVDTVNFVVMLTCTCTENIGGEHACKGLWGVGCNCLVPFNMKRNMLYGRGLVWIAV